MALYWVLDKIPLTFQRQFFRATEEHHDANLQRLDDEELKQQRTSGHPKPFDSLVLQKKGGAH